MTASENADVVKRLKALEAGISAKQSELDQYKAELESLKRVLAIADNQTPAPSPQPPIVAEGICRSQSIVDYDLVMKDPRGLQGCVVVQTVEGGVRTSTTITALGQPKGVITGSGVWKNLKYGACLAEIVFVWKSKVARGARHTWQKIL